MKKILIIIFLLISQIALGDELKVEIIPSRAVAGEVFQVYFRIFTDSDEEPQISFEQSNLEVMGNSNQGISTRTVYANGKLTVTREITIVYDLLAQKPGYANLRVIKAQLGSKTLRHPSITLDILSEPQELGDVFVMADVPKKTLFKGEGLIVRYFLYSKVPVSNLDIKRYPKLNGFLKRFLQEPERTERVSVDGQIYLRTQIYAAKLYPEKTGKLKVDPLYLSATYPQTRPGDPFGSFGMGRNFKTRSIKSDAIELQVSPLPSPLPSDFTGLVGEHEFQLQVGQTRLIVNEPLEVKLTVTGAGAMENFEAPKLIEHPGLEVFETNGDLKISSPDKATKIFDYTFLAKENLTYPQRVITLSHFDPVDKKYLTTELQMPEIVVAGGQPRQESGTQDDAASVEESTVSKKDEQKVEETLVPISTREADWKKWLPIVNLSLATLAVMISLFWVFRHYRLPRLSLRKTEVPAAFKKGEFKLSEFIQWLSPVIEETGKAPSTIIKESPLSHESKRYFIDLLNSNDYKEYSSKKTKAEFKYQASHFKQLGKYIESLKNENS